MNAALDAAKHVYKDIPNTVEDQIAVTGTLENGAVATVHYRGASRRRQEHTQ